MGSEGRGKAGAGGWCFLSSRGKVGTGTPRSPRAGVVIRVLWPAGLYGNDYGISRHEIEGTLAKVLLGF